MEIKAKVTEIYDWICDTPGREKHLVGGAGSSKSYSIAQYILLNRFLSGHKILVLRKTMPSLKMTALQLLKDLVSEYNLPAKLNKADFTLTSKINKGSIYFTGLDDPEKVKSAEFSTIWVEEATDLNLDDYRQLKLRLGRATDDAEIIFSYNPISAMHWLKTEVIDKLPIQLHKSNYKMNPYLSETYKKELEALIEQDLNYYNIYVLGEWGILENVIYPNWKTVDRMPEVDEIIYGIDFGYEAPNVLTAIGIKEKNAYVQELIYQKHMTNEEFIKKVDSLKLNKNSYFYADCAEPDRIVEFYNAGYNIIEANKDVLDGIDAVKRFNLFITKDSVNAIKEFGSYSRKKDRMGRVLEDPIKWNDHCFAKGTIIKTLQGDKPIEEVTTNDKVLTRKGYKRVLKSGISGIMETNKYVFSDGNYLIATPDHRIFTNRGFVALDSLRYYDIITTWKNKKSNLTELFLEGIRSLKTQDTLFVLRCISNKAFGSFTKRFGKVLMEKYQKGIIFITKTSTILTIQSKILFFSQLMNIFRFMANAESLIWNIWQKLDLLRLNGIDRLKVESGILNIAKKPIRTESPFSKSVLFAEKNLKTSQEMTKIDSAPTNANLKIDATRGKTTSQNNVNFVEKSSSLINIKKQGSVQENVVHLISTEKKEKQTVYDLTVEGSPEFYANNILVHNCCDAVRYGIYTHTLNGGVAELWAGL